MAKKVGLFYDPVDVDGLYEIVKRLVMEIRKGNIELLNSPGDEEARRKKESEADPAYQKLVEQGKTYPIWHFLYQPDPELLDKLCACDIVLLLITAHLMANDDLYDLLEQLVARKSYLIPIIFKPCDLEGSPIAGKSVLPQNKEPVTKWPDLDDAWADVASGIRIALELKKKE